MESSSHNFESDDQEAVERLLKEVDFTPDPEAPIFKRDATGHWGLVGRNRGKFHALPDELSLWLRAEGLLPEDGDIA